MTNKNVMIRGLDTPEHLLAWMTAAGRKNVVLKVADVLDLPQDDQRLLVGLISVASGTTEPAQRLEGSALRSRIQALGTGGYILIPREEICSLPIDDLAILQQWLAAYREVRLSKGEPSRVEPCAACSGDGRRHGKMCSVCHGEGKMIIFLEISDEESRLSCGGAP